MLTVSLLEKIIRRNCTWGGVLIPLKRTTFTEKFKPWDFEEPAPGSNMGWTFGQLVAGENKIDTQSPKLAI